ncbi:type II secretion system protein GspM [Sphingomonas cavernae]|uniref:Type II secretion system protein M n=1 Tax=Sphingomonas cavernae TaxID=2320861 RepID=A0A418WNX2_9SPHN|nr:type II secretion system protein GspM [Sphingomonas cavernae]RJF92932.1 type II secretion system protein M [Sphingomonas cavernae]
MTEKFKAWWTLRTTREQRMLLVMFALMGVVLAWMLILWVGNGVSSAREHHGLAVVDHARVAAKVEALRDYQKRAPPPLPAQIDTVVGQAAAEIGFVLTRGEPEGRDRVTIAIGSARPNAFFGWLTDLERRGIVPEKLVARANSDRTLSIEATLRGRGQ